ncbi:hypothetical protein COB11_07555 [Candidatus Aerophobetes bacterium]|uniref:PepSY domain-containing protein n=1 Tax=Aerophobetes bacterium TaxID=2030807 RepID=A0A2A4YBZ8_UNCAE|nr:MAG: hypothetical protein COB11_07555 [Candidatus Aerophobetes bacterium]
MKKLCVIAMLFALPLFGQQTAASSVYNKQLNKMEAKPERKELMSTEKTAAAQKAHESSEIMIIEPLARAQDFAEAYKYLNFHKSSAPVMFKLRNHKVLKNVLDIEIMKGGTLVIFTLNTTKGIKYEVVNIEDIKSMGNDK